jgi:cytoskeleton protein RodZ
MTTAHTNPANTMPVSGPGAQLAQARNDLHWSREEVAAKLHLSSHQIQAMEEDNYANLPGATYVRGYLKSYALLLGLSPASILDAHSKLTAKPVQQDFSNIAPQREITSRHHQIRFTTYLVAAIVVGLAVAWWVGRENRPPVPVIATAPVAPVPEAAAPVAEPSTAVTPLPEAVPSPAASPASSSAPAPAKPAVPVAAPASPVATPVTAAPIATEPKPLPITGPRAQLVLYADQDTWADIRDARQVKLLYETVPAGRAVTLEGVAPVSVFLGNASGARIEYNGKPVDIARHQRGMMARFKLGEEATTAVPAP